MDMMMALRAHARCRPEQLVDEDAAVPAAVRAAPASQVLPLTEGRGAPGSAGRPRPPGKTVLTVR
jgi:hypothetical protein